MLRAAVAEALEEMGHLLVIAGQEPHKAPTYYRAARSVRRYGGDLELLLERGGLQELPGVGPALAAKIQGVSERGSFEDLDRLRTTLPADVLSLTRVGGIGAKTAAKLYHHLGVENLSDLEAAIRRRDVRLLPGLGPRSEQQLGLALASHYAMRDKVPLHRALWQADDLTRLLLAHPGVEHVAVAGRARRRHAEVERLDLVCTSSDGAPREVELPPALPVSLHWCSAETEIFTLWRCTGSARHIEELEALAQVLGVTLEEVAAEGGEEALYRALELQPVPPELREGAEALPLARSGRMPRLLEADAIRGDLHLHTTWSDGQNSISELAAAAGERGLEYMAVTDHSQGLAVAGGLDPDRLRQQAHAVAAAARDAGFDILAGSEVEIKASGELDFPDQVLEALDLVIASIHTSFHLPQEDQTSRLVSACQNPHVDMIGHPTGRVLGYRSGYDVDLDQLVRAAGDTQTIIEINATPDRMDASDQLARLAAAAGAPLAINSDAHSAGSLGRFDYGVFVVRRAGLERPSVVNTWSGPELRSWLGQPKPQRRRDGGDRGAD